MWKLKHLLAFCLLALFLLSCSRGERSSESGGIPRGGPEPASRPSEEVRKGLQEYEKGNFFEASEWFRAAVGRHPEDYRSQYYLGYSLLKNHNPRAALAALDRAISLRGDFLQARLARARVYIRLGEYPSAAAELRRVLVQDPDNLLALFNLGFLLSRTGEYDEAIRLLERVIRLRPDHPEAPYFLGLAAMKKGDADRALRSLEEAIRLDPDNPGAYFNLGNLLMRLGRSEEAAERLRVFRKLSDEITRREHHREQIRIRAVEAYQLQKEGDLDGAMRRYEEILRIAPDHVPTVKDLAILHLAQGRPEEALRELLRATEMDPNYAPPYLHLARIYEGMGEADKAAAAADRFRMLESGEGARQEVSQRW